MNILYFMTIDEWMTELWIEEGAWPVPDSFYPRRLRPPKPRRFQELS